MRSFLKSFKRVFFGLVLGLGASASEAQLTVFNPIAIVEGTVSNATINLNFVVNKPAGAPASFTATTSGSSTATGAAAIAGGVDYLNLPTTTFNMTAAETAKIVSVKVVRDNLDEASPEFVQVDFVALGGATINGPGTSTFAIGAITDDDVATISINDISFNESAGTASFTISQNVPSVVGTSVDFTVANNTAIAPKDYTTVTLGGPAGNRSFPASPTSLTPPPSHTLVINIVDDLLDEPAENFRITLTNPTGGAVLAGAGGSVGIGIILDTPDPQPVISIDSLSFPEGSPAGVKLVNFTVSLDKASGRTIPVTVTTSDGTAGQPGDYLFKTQNFSFTEGSGLTRLFQVSVKQDTTSEPDETFNVTLSGIANATLGVGVGVGTIQNDDAALQINDVAISESGGNLVFTVTRTATAGNITFNYAASGGTAIVGGTCAVGTDYTTTTGLGSIPASVGVATTTITVPVCNDSVSEGHDTVDVTLSSVVGVTLLDGTGVGTIINDDAIPSGALKISEFRYNGPDGVDDQFIEIANTTPDPVIVGTMSVLDSGFAVASNGTTLFVIPNGTTIPGRGHFLGVGADYSLGDFGGSAPGDISFLATLGTDEGIALFDTTSLAGSALDAVGFTGDAAPYVEITPMPAAAIPPGVVNHAFVRKYLYGGTGLQDSTNSLADWVLVATNPAADVSLNDAVLGGPSPEGLASETERTTTEVQMGLCNTNQGPYAGDNYAFTPVNNQLEPIAGFENKFIELRRTFTNMTQDDFGSVRFKATSLSVLGSNGGGTEADYRVTTSQTYTNVPEVGPPPCTAHALTLEGGEQPTVAFENIISPQSSPAYPFSVYNYDEGADPSVIDIQSTVPGAGAYSSPMGGLNSTLRLSAVPLGAGNTVGVNFKLYYTTSGIPGFFWVTVGTTP